MPIRTIFYIDGYNFYHGIKSATYLLDKSWNKYNWIDHVKFANQFLDKSHELVCVKYFKATPLETDSEKRQSAFIGANKLINQEKLQIIKGMYYKKQIKCQADCKKYFDIHEEKRTDVNIAVEIMEDAALCHNLELPASLIAATAIVTDLELFTYNVRDFKFIMGLKQIKI